LIPFIARADKNSSSKGEDGTDAPNAFAPPTLVDYHPPNRLIELLDFNLPMSGGGKDGLLNALKSILQFSVNTWDRGFMDKLYASTNAVSTVFRQR
jgi:glutamate decarboxylase